MSSSELLVVVQVSGGTGTLTNTATVSSEEDPEGENNTASAQVEVIAGNEGSAQAFFVNGGTLQTSGGQPGWNVTMTVNADQPAGFYRLTELADIPQSKGNVEYEAPEGAVVTVDVACAITQCPKRRVLDLLVIVIKTDDDGSQHLLPPCRITIPRKNRPPIIINTPPPCVISVTRANATAPLVWTVRLLGGPDPGVRGR
jgi:hypothetical protein